MSGMYARIADRIGDVAIPAKPQGTGGEYQFPEDPTLLSTEEVGIWMFKLTAWNGYVLRNLALADLTAAEVRSQYETLMQQALAQISERKGKTRVQLNTEALASNANIITLKEQLDEASAEVSVWERLHRIYEAQVAVLSREISRRTSEFRTESRNPI